MARVGVGVVGVEDGSGQSGGWEWPGGWRLDSGPADGPQFAGARSWRVRGRRKLELRTEWGHNTSDVVEPSWVSWCMGVAHTGWAHFGVILGGVARVVALCGTGCGTGRWCFSDPYLSVMGGVWRLRGVLWDFSSGARVVGGWEW